jgi:LEA14-like dessication related protein
MKKGWKIVLLSLLVLVVLGGVIIVTTPTKKLISLLAPEIDNIRVTDTRIGEETATMNVLMDVKPSFVSTFVDSMVYDFKLYNTSVAHGQKSFERDANQKKQTIRFPMTMNHNKTRELVRRQVQEGEKVQAHIEAYADVPLFGRQKFDIDENLDMLIPALPGATVSNLKITDFGLDEMEMVMTMNLDNPNDFDFYIRDMKMTLHFPEKMSSVGGTIKDYLVKARSVTPISISAVSDVKKPLKTTFKTLTGDQVWQYNMKTYMVLEPKSDVVGTIHMDAVKTGQINVVQQVKQVLKTRKEEKKAEKQEKKEEKQESK